MFSLNSAKTRLESSLAPIRQEHRDPNSKPGLNPKNIVIHGIQAPSMQSAVTNFLGNARSMHLLIERNGLEIEQMVELDRQAFHANEYDPNSFGIGLIYPGYLTERTGFFYSRDRFDPLEILLASPIQEDKKRWYPFYPQAQLDALLEIARLFDQVFGLDRILLSPEANQWDLITGPAFPLNRFQQLLEGEGAVADLLEETSTAVDLFLQPGGVGPKFLSQPLPSGTPITVLDDEGEWVLVEVMADLGERRWTIGWMRADKVAAKPFVPKINQDHRLVTETNHRIKFIPAHPKNFNANKKIEPRFVVIHFTTGTNMQSIVHTFQNPDEGVCTHLLVGRSGHVVQFVPFDTVAFHCGLSTWEGIRDLNRFAIGIEVDNAGYLDNTKKGFKRKGKIIPDNQVKFKRHWKEQGERPWQTFSDEQFRVVKEIVIALKEKYPTIEEIVGHDMVNLVNRLDPGPFYLIGELREAVLGDPQFAIQPYLVAQECPIFENLDNSPPRLVPHPDFGELPKNSVVRIREVHDPWSLVKVKQSSRTSLREKEGWILAKSTVPVEDKAKTKFPQTFYQVIPAVVPRLPPLELKTGPLPQGTQVRNQFEVGDWMLVAPVLEVRKDEEDHYELVVPKDKVKKYFREGWVKKEFLEKLPLNT